MFLGFSNSSGIRAHRVRHTIHVATMATESEDFEKRARYMLHFFLAISYASHVYGYTINKYTQDAILYAIVTFVIVMVVSCSALHNDVHADIQQILFAGCMPALLILLTKSENQNNLKYAENDKKTVNAIILNDGVVVTCSLLMLIISPICMSNTKVSVDRVMSISISLVGYVVRVIHQFQRVKGHIPSSQLISFLTAVAFQRRDSSLCSCNSEYSELPDPDRHKRCGVFNIFITALVHGVVCGFIKWLNGSSFSDALPHCFYCCGVPLIVILLVELLSRLCFIRAYQAEEFLKKAKVFLSLLSPIYTLCHAYWGIHTQQLMDNHLGFMLAYAMT